MNQEERTKILDQAAAPPLDPNFLRDIFFLTAKKKEKERIFETDNLKRVIEEEYEALSERLETSWIQEGCAVRNVLKTRRLARLLVDDEGRLLEGLLPRVITFLEKRLYSLGPKRQYDAKRNRHLLKVLTLLRDTPKLRRALMRVGKPYQHPYAEQIIRDTLQIPTSTHITDAHARRAALAAWMCLLRQSVGSCFATAPAIIVQEEQPELFLRDLNELLSTGRLKRVVGGREFTVPLSYSWGRGDLRKMFLLSNEMFQDESGIWDSPGLEAAFERAGIFEDEGVSRSELMKRILYEAFKGDLAVRPYQLVTVELLLRKVLLRHFGLTEEDVKEYESRPLGMVHGGLLMTVSRQESAAAGKGKQCAHFLKQFDEAQNAFKALADNALLKSWEFSVASFAETKAEFTRWNLYSSLGLAADEQGGIGPCLYEILSRKLEECNQKVHDMQQEYEQAFNQLQFMQNRVRSAQDEKQAKWYRAEYQAKVNEFHTLEEIRNRAHFKAKRYANLYNDLVEVYYRMFPRYFQEIYDADMHEVTSGPYDDSPAGFRLVYKHGRENTSQWTRIQNHVEFIDALSSFFTASESEVAGAPELQGLEEDIGEITTAIVNHVRTKEFLESAFWRMAKAHNAPIVEKPLEHLEKLEKKPWVYTSGGALTTLVSSYFKLEHKPTDSSRWVESPLELLTFLVDSLKQLPERTMREYEENENRSMIIHSPTHAFLLKPGRASYREAWQSKEFTYTWLRDRFVHPAKQFFAQMFLDHDQRLKILEYLLPDVPAGYRTYFSQYFSAIRGPMLVRDFRQHMVDAVASERGLQMGRQGVVSSEQIDAALFELLPFFPSYQLEERGEKVLGNLRGIDEESRRKFIEALRQIASRIRGANTVSFREFQNILLAAIMLVRGDTSLEQDFSDWIIQAARSLGYASPSPITIADTNWVKEEFAFVLNPGTSELEFWRMDYLGRSGSPMRSWDIWLNGSRKKPDWGIYTKPHEYHLQI